MNKFIFRSGVMFCFLAVSFGAFGAHAFKETLLQTGYQATFETGVKFQFYHSLALLIVALLSKNNNSKNLMYSAYSFILGILLFSGSLYFLSLTGEKNLGIITPFGGVSFLAGWGFLYFSKLT